MPTITKRRASNSVILSRKEYEELRKAAGELDTLKAILIHEEEREPKSSNRFKTSVI